MIRGLLGRKIGMSQIFDKDGNVVPVTVVEAGPCIVMELKSSPLKVKLGFEPIKESKVRKPQLGFFKKIGVSPLRLLKEFSSTDNNNYKVGQEIKADLFKPGDFVDVTGISIGKGFQGGMKRWHWSGGNMSHGSTSKRRVGSIGSSSDPSRVFKGHHMPGRMGNRQITMQNLRVMGIDLENNFLLIKGAVPGYQRGYLSVNLSRKRKFKSLDEVAAISKKIRNPMKQSKSKAKGKA